MLGSREWLWGGGVKGLGLGVVGFGDSGIGFGLYVVSTVVPAAGSFRQL